MSTENSTQTLPDLPFSEFTAQLLSDTFDALVSANIDQTQTYIELVRAVAQGLAAYVEQTQEEVGHDAIEAFLVRALPNHAKDTESKLSKATTLSAEDALALNAALALPEADGGLKRSESQTDNQVAKAGKIGDALTDISEAARRRLAADRFALLSEVVRMGVLRLVVDDGLIETKLEFSAVESSEQRSFQGQQANTRFTGSLAGGTSRAASKLFDASGQLRLRRMKVRTKRSSSSGQQDNSSSIIGTVRIQFHTDHQPLGSS